MRITYVAKHNSGGNDDEGAILHSLVKLGYSVKCIHEKNATKNNIEETKPDFLLCHNLSNITVLSQIKAIKVFWYFDLVVGSDPTLRLRNHQRKLWAIDMMRQCDFGFFTDGDFAAVMNRSYPGRAFHLPQGFDERLIKPFQISKEMNNLVIFASEKGGKEREDWFNTIKKDWESGGFLHHYRRGIYRESMQEKVLEFKIAISPAYPITDSYWSNRVYLITGFGGFLIHPYSEKLSKEYPELVMYSDKRTLNETIKDYLYNPRLRNIIAESCYNTTITEFTYTKRIKRLIETVRNCR